MKGRARASKRLAHEERDWQIRTSASLLRPLCGTGLAPGGEEVPSRRGSAAHGISTGRRIEERYSELDAGSEGGTTAVFLPEPLGRPRGRFAGVELPFRSRSRAWRSRAICSSRADTMAWRDITFKPTRLVVGQRGLRFPALRLVQPQQRPRQPQPPNNVRRLWPVTAQLPELEHGRVAPPEPTSSSK